MIHLSDEQLNNLGKESLCWIMSIPMEVMYWQIVDTTVTS